MINGASPALYTCTTLFAERLNMAAKRLNLAAILIVDGDTFAVATAFCTTCANSGTCLSPSRADTKRVPTNSPASRVSG